MTTHAEDKSVSKETIFFWADASSLKNKTSQEVRWLFRVKNNKDFDATSEEIWQNYFLTSSKIVLSENCKEDLKTQFSKGRPYCTTLYEKAADEVFLKLNSGHLSTRFGNFAQAAIYK
jgi:hypothetical protein